MWRRARASLSQNSANFASTISASAAQPISRLEFGAGKNSSVRSLPPAARQRTFVTTVLKVCVFASHKRLFWPSQAPSNRKATNVLGAASSAAPLSAPTPSIATTNPAEMIGIDLRTTPSSWYARCILNCVVASAAPTQVLAVAARRRVNDKHRCNIAPLESGRMAAPPSAIPKPPTRSHPLLLRRLVDVQAYARGFAPNQDWGMWNRSHRDRCMGADEKYFIPFQEAALERQCSGFAATRYCGGTSPICPTFDPSRPPNMEPPCPLR
jgi:hypothetical protein